MNAAAEELIEIRPQAGLQEEYLSTPADIAIGGGTAGSGKTFSLLMEPLRHLDNPHFSAVVFRRTMPQLTNPGGLWDEAFDLYAPYGASAHEVSRVFRFPSGMYIKFAHMQHAKNRGDWKGAQIPLIAFDQLEDFEARMFWYLLSRNRSVRADVRPYIRATCNPVPESDPIGGWLNKLISWWIDQETGYAIQERSGVLRYFVRLENEIHWADSPDELADKFPDVVTTEERNDEDKQKIVPKSLTFIPGSLDENLILQSRDPGYRATLDALPLVDRERLLKGNWLITEGAGTILKRAWFKSHLDALPTDIVAWVRYWDTARSEGAGKFSSGTLMGKRANGRYLMANITRGRWGILERDTIMRQTAYADKARFGHVETWVEQEPAKTGKENAEAAVKNLAGFDVKTERVTGDKATRCKPFAAQAEAGNIDLLADHVIAPVEESNPVGGWIEPFLFEAENFDGVHGFTDQIDSTSGAFNKLALGPGPATTVPVAWG